MWILRPKKKKDIEPKMNKKPITAFVLQFVNNFFFIGKAKPLCFSRKAHSIFDPGVITDVDGQVRRRLTAHEVDIKDLEAAVRGEGLETPREEIARLRRLQVEPQHYDLDINKEARMPLDPALQ